MRYSKNKSQNSSKDLDENASTYLQMELELMGMKAKNADLIKAHTKLVQENADMRNQIYSLQADLVNIELKYNNIKSYITNLQQNMRKCTPSLINLLNLFMDINSKSPLTCLENSITSYTPPTKSITHSVQPHTVNGTVLNLNPIITLTRLSTLNNNTNESLNSSNAAPINNAPCTSTLVSDSIDNPEIEENANSENGNIYVSSRRINISSNNDSLNESVEEILNPNQNSTDGQLDMNKLSVIPEESYSLEAQQKCRFSEIKICLSPLARSGIENALNASSSSTMANLNDTLNESNVEGVDNRVSKRLKADILFSPYTNSTRLEYDDPYFDQSVQVKRLPTPSTSAMGDIDKQIDSPLDIFTELPQNATGISPISPIPPTKSSLTPRKSSILYEDQSPRSSKQSIRSQTSKTKSVLSDSINNKIATVVLERLDILTGNKKNDHFSKQSEEKLESKTQKNNENKSKKSKLKSNSKSPKKSIKRKHNDELLGNKLTEIKNRLSLCMPDTEDLADIRPKRAARPKDLRDASLKIKLRRLF